MSNTITIDRNLLRAAYIELQSAAIAFADLGEFNQAAGKAAVAGELINVLVHEKEAVARAMRQKMAQDKPSGPQPDAGQEQGNKI